MSRVLRLALLGALAGVACLGLGSTSAFATCPQSLPGALGVFGASYDAGSCGADPFRVFWLVGKGNPALGQGVDQGSSPVFVDSTPGSIGLSFDWGNAGVDNCPEDLAALQCDNSRGPMAVLLQNPVNEGSPGRSTNYKLISTDFDESFTFYNLDLAVPGTLSCTPLPTPVIGGSSGSGPFSVNLSWGALTSSNDCATNPSATACGDCSGGTRNLLNNWKVYSTDAQCTCGPLSGDRSLWFAEATLPASANSGSLVTISAAGSGQCRFVAVSPLLDSGFEGGFVSGFIRPLLTPPDWLRVQVGQM